MSSKQIPISKTTLSFVNIAASEAQNSDMHFKHGCALVGNGKILARGHNHTRNSISNQAKQLNIPTNMGPLCSLHAEMHCLLNFAKIERCSNRNWHPTHSCQSNPRGEGGTKVAKAL